MKFKLINYKYKYQTLPHISYIYVNLSHILSNNSNIYIFSEFSLLFPIFHLYILLKNPTYKNFYSY